LQCPPRIFATCCSTPRFVSLSGFGADQTTAIADLAVLYTGPALADNVDALEYKRVKSASGDIDEAVNAYDKKKPAP